MRTTVVVVDRPRLAGAEAEALGRQTVLLESNPAAAVVARVLLVVPRRMVRQVVPGL